MELKIVVVTGLGAITPIGNSVPEFWENLVNGVSGAGPITHFDAQNSEKCAKLCIYLVKYLRKTINIHSFAPQI